MIRNIFTKKSKKASRRRAITAMLLAGVMMLTACGKTVSSGTEEREKTPISTGAVIEENKITAERGRSTNLSASLTPTAVTSSTAEAEKKFVNSTADFSFDLMRELLKRDKGQNVMISPDSLITALGMTENGAAGDTLKAMQNVLAADLSIDEYNKALAGFNQLLTGSDEVTFNSGNSIWVRNTEEMEISQAFLQTVVDYYNSEFYLADFDNKTLDDVNNWIKENTNGMIDKVLDEISEDAQMLLINAIAFEGEWADEYKESQIREGRQFNNANGIKEEAVMLASSEEGLISLNGGVGFGRAYKGGQFEFVAILPPEGVGADEFINGISGEDFVNAYLNKDYDQMVYAEIPEFKYDYKTKLSDQLKDMGMEVAFSDYADFSGMLASGLPELKIAEVIHKTHIEVDRKGTKAAAVTVVEMEKCAGIREENPRKTVKVILDRPFMYAIVNTETGLPVFLGTVNSVK
ncbi:MAG: serpin family protein [Eubacterium sp.]|nr:serpin family protein [Eubacterium sp.]